LAHEYLHGVPILYIVVLFFKYQALGVIWVFVGCSYVVEPEPQVAATFSGARQNFSIYANDGSRGQRRSFSIFRYPS
jgi:hypothetical protein